MHLSLMQREILSIIHSSSSFTTNFRQKIYSLIMDTDEDTVLTGTGNNGKLYSISRSDKTGWTVVDCTNVRELLSKSRQAQSIYVLTAVVLVIVALLFSRFMARSITLPIQKLARFHEKSSGRRFQRF